MVRSPARRPLRLAVLAGIRYSLMPGRRTMRKGAIDNSRHFDLGADRALDRGDRPCVHSLRARGLFLGLDGKSRTRCAPGSRTHPYRGDHHGTTERGNHRTLHRPRVGYFRGHLRLRRIAPRQSTADSRPRPERSPPDSHNLDPNRKQSGLRLLAATPIDLRLTNSKRPGTDKRTRRLSARCFGQGAQRELPKRRVEAATSRSARWSRCGLWPLIASERLPGRLHNAPHALRESMGVGRKRRGFPGGRRFSRRSPVSPR